MSRKVKNQFQSRVPWREKMERAQEPRLVQVPPKMSRFGKGMMLIPTPKLVDEIVRQVRRSRLVTVGEIPQKAGRGFLGRCNVPADDGHLHSHRGGSCGRGSREWSEAGRALLAGHQG